ncbi:MAG: hypothetical protein NT090_04725 [Acidobacteria bacterium]|nr:hypothetical protein [Acidobacteriota bacterium]
MSKPAGLVQGTLDLPVLKTLAPGPMRGWSAPGSSPATSFWQFSTTEQASGTGGYEMPAPTRKKDARSCRRQVLRISTAASASERARAATTMPPIKMIPHRPRLACVTTL